MINVLIDGKIEQRDEADLLRTAGGFEDDNEKTTWVEYCQPDCSGQAHTSGVHDAEGLFCAHHIHRSVDIFLKKPLTLESAVGGFV